MIEENMIGKLTQMLNKYKIERGVRTIINKRRGKEIFLRLSPPLERKSLRLHQDALSVVATTMENVNRVPIFVLDTARAVPSLEMALACSTLIILDLKDDNS